MRVSPSGKALASQEYKTTVFEPDDAGLLDEQLEKIIELKRKLAAARTAAAAWKNCAKDLRDELLHEYSKKNYLFWREFHSLRRRALRTKTNRINAMREADNHQPITSNHLSNPAE